MSCPDRSEYIGQRRFPEIETRRPHQQHPGDRNIATIKICLERSEYRTVAAAYLSGDLNAVVEAYVMSTCMRKASQDPSFAWPPT
jgi:hypothetical protein